MTEGDDAMSENDFIRGVKHGKEQMRIESSNLRKELSDKDARIKELEEIVWRLENPHDAELKDYYEGKKSLGGE